MAVETIQCPKCGAALGTTDMSSPMVCDYCGSMLQLTVGASGHPLASLMAIKADTSIVAKQAAIDYLQKQLQERIQHKAGLDTSLTSRCNSVKSRWPLWAIMGGILGWIIAAMTIPSFASLLIVVLALVSIGLSEAFVVPRSIAKIQQRYAKDIADADERIQAQQSRIQQLRRDVDRLAHTV